MTDLREPFRVLGIVTLGPYPFGTRLIKRRAWEHSWEERVKNKKSNLTVSLCRREASRLPVNTRRNSHVDNERESFL